jgi:hypothetical protein
VYVRKESVFRITQYLIMGIIGVARPALWALYRPETNYMHIMSHHGLAGLFVPLPLNGRAQVFPTCLTCVTTPEHKNSLIAHGIGASC